MSKTVNTLSSDWRKDADELPMLAPEARAAIRECADELDRRMEYDKTAGPVQATD